MNILIVDDDVMIRNWLTLLLGQIKEYTLTIFSAGDVDTALQCCQENSIDLVITDITMPHRTGLELIEILRGKYPSIKTAVLSAYDHYEYIRYALKLGALDYILKSEMKLEDIYALLEKVTLADTMEGSIERVSSGDFVRLQQANLALSQFVSETENCADTLFTTLGIPIPPDNTCIYAFTLNRQPEEEYTYFPVQNILNKTLAGALLSGICCAWGSGLFILLYEPHSNIQECREEEAMKLSLLCQRNLSSYFGLDILFDVHKLNRDARQLRSCLLDCLNLLENRTYYHEKAEENCSSIHLSEAAIKSFHSSLKTALELHQPREALQLLETFVQQQHAVPVNCKELKAATTYAVTLMFMGMEKQQDSLHSLDFHYFTQMIDRCKTAEELENALHIFSRFYLSCQPEHKAVIGTSIRQAIDYINQYYMKKLTLEDIASHVYLNKTYVSQLFKKQLNISFGEYLEAVRINKAKELIANSHMSITQVSEEVGYTSQSYFTKVFKKQMGMGPLQYRALVSSQRNP